MASRARTRSKRLSPSSKKHAKSSSGSRRHRGLGESQRPPPRSGRRSPPDAPAPPNVILLQPLSPCSDGASRRTEMAWVTPRLRVAATARGPESENCPWLEACSGVQTSSGSVVSSHSRQTQSPLCVFCALSAAGAIVTPQAGQIGGRSWSSDSGFLPSGGSSGMPNLTQTVQATPQRCDSGAGSTHRLTAVLAEASPRPVSSIREVWRVLPRSTSARRRSPAG